MIINETTVYCTKGHEDCFNLRLSAWYHQPQIMVIGSNGCDLEVFELVIAELGLINSTALSLHKNEDFILSYSYWLNKLEQVTHVNN